MIEKLNLLENTAFDFEKWLINQSFELLNSDDCSAIHKMYCYYSEQCEFNVYVNIQNDYLCRIYLTTADFQEIKADFYKFQEKSQYTLAYIGLIPSNTIFAETLFAHLLYEEECE